MKCQPENRKYALLLGAFFVCVNLFAQPSIDSFTPLSGLPGSVVTLTGSGFSPVAANNIVYFGAVKGTVTAASATSLTATVPNGATYGLIKVTSNNLTTYSRVAFLVTYPDGDADFHPGYFASTQKYDAGAEPMDIATGDFDSDGKADLVTANRYSNTVSVFLNTGTPGSAQLAAKSDIPTGLQPVSVAVGDVDGDGKLDLAVANKGAKTVSIFRNTSSAGSISFSAATNLATVTAPEGVEISDVNLDGRPDIVVGGANLLATYSNLSNTPGTVSFDAKKDITTSINVYYITVRDLDIDGKPEIIATNPFTSSMDIYRNNSLPGITNFFAFPVTYPTVYGPGRTEVGDLDKNSMPDIVVSCNGGVMIFRNIGSMNSFAFATGIQLPSTGGGGAVSLNDMNGDGKLDLVRVTGNNDSIAVYKNISPPGNVILAPRASYKSYWGTINLCTDDMDGDGKPDIATMIYGGNQTGGFVAVLRNRGNEPTVNALLQNNGCAVAGSTITIRGRKFTGATAVTTGGGTKVTSYTVLSDTSIQAVVPGPVLNNVTVTSKYGSGTFDIPSPTINRFTPTIGKIGAAVTITGSYFCGTTAVNLGGTPAASFTVNSDTSITAIVGGAGSGFIYVTTPYGKDSLTGFFTGTTITSVTPSAGKPGIIVTIKGTGFNSTAAQNVVYFGAVRATVISARDTMLTVTVPAGATYQPVTVTANGLTAYSNQPFTPTFEGGITITPESFDVKSDLATGNGPIGAAIADFDQDGKADLAVVNNGANSVSVYRNTAAQGVVSFSAKVDYATGHSPYSAAVGDFDGDGKPDLVISNSAGESVSVYKNTSSTGAVTFSNSVTFNATNVPRSLYVSDFDGDGKPDIAMVTDSIFQFAVTIIRNNTVNGIISFESPYKYGFNWLASGSYSICVADLDNDGRPDIAATNKNSAAVSVFKNNSTPGIISLSARVDHTTGAFPYGVAAGDLNGDNKPELAIAGNNSNTLSVLKNISSPGTVSLEVKKDFATGANPYWVAISDLDGNSKPDVAVTNGNAASVSVFANKCVGDSIILASKIDFTSGLQPYHVNGADLDGDGKPELIIVNNQSNTVSILKNKVGEPRLMPSGTNPVSGNVITKVTVDSVVQTYNGNPYVQRHYDIEPVNNPATATATVTLFFSQTDFDNFNASPAHGLDLPTGPNDAAGKANLRVYQYHGFSTTSLPGTYTGNGLEINPDDSKIVWNATNQWWEVTFDVNGFSGFFVTSAGKDFTTPVQFVSFTGTADEANNTLEWVVNRISQVNSFDLLRSVDSLYFTSVTTVPATPATGTTNVKYSYTDKPGLATEYYYQIKMLHADGRNSYSNIIKITSAIIQTSITIYPNPAKRIAVIGHPATDKLVQLRVIDMAGKVVKKVTVPANSVQTKISVAELSAGVYKIVWQDGSKKYQQNMLVD